MGRRLPAQSPPPIRCDCPAQLARLPAAGVCCTVLICRDANHALEEVRHERRRMKFTEYFHSTRNRPDRAFISLDWIQRVIDDPVREELQQDGRIRRWGRVAELDGKYLRVILLPDGETVHNAFIDGRFRP